MTSKAFVEAMISGDKSVIIYISFFVRCVNLCFVLLWCVVLSFVVLHCVVLCSVALCYVVLRLV